jgi:hypothetical protein
MRNYNQDNMYQTSKEYYFQVLKKDKTNLNSSGNKLNYLDCYLEKLLAVTYQFFNPFFADEESSAPYKNEYTSSTIDREFDEKVNNQIPSWLFAVIEFVRNVYHLFFPIKIIHKKLQTFQKSVYFEKLAKLSLVKIIINFFTLNSPP